MPRLEEWSTGIYCNTDMYTPPEHNKCLRGRVYDHPKMPDGSFVKTSPFVCVNGNIAQTTNTSYELGEPNPDFVQWCKDKGCHVPTKEEPFKCHKSQS